MSYEPARGDARESGEEEPRVFEQYPIASFTANGGTTYYFPVTDIEETGGNRLVKRERPYRKGAKLDSTGELANGWNVTCLFNNTLTESGLNGNDLALYPHVLNKLVEAFKIQKTGDLVLPTTGGKRARCDTYRRKEMASERDQATLVFTFIEDNEDDVDASSLGAPSVSANAIRVTEQTVFSMEEDGAWDTSVQDLKEAAAALEGLANSPDTMLQDLESEADVAMAAADRVISIFSQPNIPGRSIFSRNASSANSQKKIGETKELAGKVRLEARRSRPRLQTVQFESQQSVASISGMLGLTFTEILSANPQLENPLLIPAKTPVRIPSDGPINRQG